MFKRTNSSKSNERLDHIGREIVRASRLRDEEAESISSSPFLYTRLRARIATERERLEAVNSWLGWFSIARRAILAMALAAAVAFGTVLFTGSNASDSSSYLSDEDAEGIVFVERRALSNDEVLDTILNEDEREAAK